MNQTEYRAWEAWVRAVQAACEARGRGFGVVRIGDMTAAYEAQMDADAFVEAQLARPAPVAPTFAQRPDDDAALGFTRD